MFFEQLEKDIQQRLKDKVGTGIEVELLPEREADFRRPFQAGRLSVCYKQSDFDKPLSTAQISQDEDQTFEVVIQARALRGLHGIYDLANRTRIALVGYIPTNARRVSAVSFKFEAKEENLWVYVFTFTTKSTIVEVAEDEVLPLIQEITQESTYNISTITTNDLP